MGNKPKPIKGKKFQRIVNYFFKFFKMSATIEDTAPVCCYCYGYEFRCPCHQRRPQVTVTEQPQLATEEKIKKQDRKIQVLEEEIRQLREETKKLKVENQALKEENRKLKLKPYLKKLKKLSSYLQTKQDKLTFLVGLQKKQEEEALARLDKVVLPAIRVTEVEIIEVQKEIDRLLEDIERLKELLQLKRQQQICLDDRNDNKLLSASNNGDTEQKATTSFSVTTSKEKTTLEEEAPEEQAISTFYKELEEAVNDSYNSRYDPDYKPPFSTSEESSFVSGATGDSDSFLQSGPTPDDSTNVKNDPEEKAEQKGPESLLMDDEEHKNPTPCEDDYKTPNEKDEHENKGAERAQYEY